ncbi:MAG: hypothetical protein ACIARR_00355 [Phycisphaerales bacterium JB059]
MKSAIAIAAVAGLATVASAQNVGTVTLTSSATDVLTGETFTIGVMVTDNISGNSVFGFDVEVVGSGVAFTSSAPVAEASIFGFNGAATATGATALGGSSDILGPDLDPSLDGLVVYTFQVTAGSEVGVIDFAAIDGVGPNAAMQWGLGGGIVIVPQEYDSIEFNGLSVNVTPAPSGMALLGLGGLVAARRRR